MDCSWTMGGDVMGRCVWEVGDPRGGDRELLTYDCLRPWVCVVFSKSSWWTATLKRFQNWGSRTILCGVWVD